MSPGATLKPVTVAVGPPDGKPAPIVTAWVANSVAPAAVRVVAAPEHGLRGDAGRARRLALAAGGGGGEPERERRSASGARRRARRSRHLGATLRESWGPDPISRESVTFGRHACPNQEKHFD